MSPASGLGVRVDLFEAYSGRTAIPLVWRSHGKDACNGLGSKEILPIER
jgi:hypothetical protein